MFTLTYRVMVRVTIRVRVHSARSQDKCEVDMLSKCQGLG